MHVVMEPFCASNCRLRSDKSLAIIRRSPPASSVSRPNVKPQTEEEAGSKPSFVLIRCRFRSGQQSEGFGWFARLRRLFWRITVIDPKHRENPRDDRRSLTHSLTHSLTLKRMILREELEAGNHVLCSICTDLPLPDLTDNECERHHGLQAWETSKVDAMGAIERWKSHLRVPVDCSEAVFWSMQQRRAEMHNGLTTH